MMNVYMMLVVTVATALERGTRIALPVARLSGYAMTTAGIWLLT
jgi:hypothetical protein